MPIFKHFKATSIHKAFLLNALASSLVASIAVIVKDRLDRTKFADKYKYMAVLGITFIASLIVYYLLFITVGFGGGMLSN